MWAWLIERTGLAQIWQAFCERRLPELRGPAAWLYTLGSATLFVWLIQVVTGILLAMNYVPSPDHAYDSVRYITEQVLFGRVVRGVHHWGASVMVILVILHLLRVYFMGAYKYPREVTWMTGVVLFLLVLAFGFTGYLLPWDQKAYWATAVGTNLVGQVPGIGPMLTTLLRGGQDTGAATLTRFYAMHVLILPLATVLLIGMHLFLVVRHGISEPPERQRRVRSHGSGK